MARGEVVADLWRGGDCPVKRRWLTCGEVMIDLWRGDD
jgi:hypothetical protein